MPRIKRLNRFPRPDDAMSSYSLQLCFNCAEIVLLNDERLTIMVSLEAVRASNAKLKNLSPGLVALFVGATSGIGESALRQFYRQTNKPRVYFVGRNEDAANRLISELKGSQPDGEITFIRKDLTLLQSVDEVCEEIKAKEKKLNLLFMSQGAMSLKGREETTEGLEQKLVKNYYGRLRFTHQLLPLLQSASPELSRVVSVLGAGTESNSFKLSDLDLKQNFSLMQAATHAIVMTDFAFEEASKLYPTTSFVHTYPGFVKTGFMRETGPLFRLVGGLLTGLLTPLAVNFTESGERHLHAATSRIYPARQEGNAGSVESPEAQGVKKGSDGVVGSGAYLIGWNGERRANDKVLKALREQDAGKKIWQHTIDTFRSVRG